MERWGVVIGMVALAFTLATPSMMPQPFAVALFWIGMALFPVAAVVAFWETKFVRMVRGWIGLSQATMVPMDDAVRYVRSESRWALEHEDDARWFMTIQRDVHDALRMGFVQTYGRPATAGGEIPAGFPSAMEPIPAVHWREYAPEIMDGMVGNKTSNISCIRTQRRLGFYEIQFDRASMRQHWPRMGLIERRKHKPLALT